MYFLLENKGSSRARASGRIVRVRETPFSGWREYSSHAGQINSKDRTKPE